MKRSRSGYMTVSVDLDEALENICDEALLREIKERKLSMACDADEPLEEIQEEIQEAREALLGGRPAEALAILDRLIRPKWSHQDACERDYRKAMRC